MRESKSEEQRTGKKHWQCLKQGRMNWGVGDNADTRCRGGEDLTF